MKDDPVLGMLMGIIGIGLAEEIRKVKERTGSDPESSPEEHARAHADDLAEFRGRREAMAKLLNPEVADQLIAVREIVGKICLGGHPPIALLLTAATDIAASGDKAAIMAAMGGLMKITVAMEQREVATTEMTGSLDGLIRRAMGLSGGDGRQQEPTDGLAGSAEPDATDNH